MAQMLPRVVFQESSRAIGRGDAAPRPVGEDHVFPRGMFYLFQAKGGFVRAAIKKEQFKWSHLTSQRLLVITWTPRREWTILHLLHMAEPPFQ